MEIEPDEDRLVYLALSVAQAVWKDRDCRVLLWPRSSLCEGKVRKSHRLSIRFEPCRLPFSAQLPAYKGKMKGLHAERPFLKDGRGDWRSFEPHPQLIAPIRTLFDGPTETYLAAVERLVRLCA